MERQRDGLVSIGEAFSGLDDGPVKAIRENSPQTKGVGTVLWRLATALVVVLALSSCASRGYTHPPQQQPPKPISLLEGVKEVMRALDELTMRPEDAPIHGLMPAEVEIVFQVQAQRSQENSVDVNISVLDIVEAGAERATEVTRSAGNTITIRLRNIVFAMKNKLIGFKGSPHETERIVR